MSRDTAGEIAGEAADETRAGEAAAVAGEVAVERTSEVAGEADPDTPAPGCEYDAICDPSQPLADYCDVDECNWCSCMRSQEEYRWACTASICDTDGEDYGM